VQLLGTFDIICLVLNRTIGSGIFTVPPKILAGMGSIGASLLLWLLGGLIILCAVLCWLELGLPLPMHTVRQGDELVKVSAPRSGGEKNYASSPNNSDNVSILTVLSSSTSIRIHHS
jgi:hypothetical protein